MNKQQQEHIESLVDAYALGALDPQEMARVEDHIAVCADCRALTAAARANADALLYAAPPAEPPRDLRRRVIERVRAVAEAERTGAIPALRPRPDVETRQQGLLARVLGRRRRDADDETLAQLAALVANPDSRVWPVAGTAEAPSARGELVGIPGGREAVLVTAGLARLGPDKAYQVWLLRAGQPTPSTLFRVGRGGEGRLVIQSAERLRDLDMVAVTPEPVSGSPAPTGPIVLAGQLST